MRIGQFLNFSTQKLLHVLFWIPDYLLELINGNNTWLVGIFKKLENFIKRVLRSLEISSLMSNVGDANTGSYPKLADKDLNAAANDFIILSLRLATARKLTLPSSWTNSLSDAVCRISMEIS